MGCNVTMVPVVELGAFEFDLAFNSLSLNFEGVAPLWGCHKFTASVFQEVFVTKRLLCQFIIMHN